MRKWAWTMNLVLLLAASVGLATADAGGKCEPLWAQRENRVLAEQAMSCYAEAAQANPGIEPAWVKLALAGYYLGELIPPAEKAARLKAYEQGKEAALQAMKLNPHSVGGNFWAVVLNGRVTEIKGLLSGTFDFGMCIKSMTEVTAQDSRYYHGGVYRFWGRFVHEIPSIGRRMARFTLQDAADLYRKSIEIEPNFLAPLENLWV
jgi:tetratricopeptide (TPR) repeat protein